ncbi:DMT family transporter [Noviherbaspirillum sp. Root189]|uniref:DMT family transporter n=1 Tax=Noviherbaspirillum sp. Root189 TaxID=1736487 RepID=UPI00070A7934|nr:DMT family transporter [Noviherbaspirillum sp. Root189]KRB85051.1 multidrug DMT transporter permease [Noviherbaspirillum sp. Root189]
MPDSRSIGLLCLLATSIGWGLNWPAMKFLLQEWPPLFARGTSGLCAALIIALIAAATGRSLIVPRAYFGRISLSAFFNIFAWMGFSTLSMRWLNAGQGALLVYTMPVWATLFAWPFLGRKPGAKSIVGLALCLAGIALLFAGSTSGIEAGKWPGVLFALAAAMLFALGTVALKPLPIDPLALVSWQLAIGCLPMVLFGVLFEHPELSALSFRGGAVMVYMTLVPMGLCYIMWFAALRRVPPALASIATLLTPVVGVFAAALSLGEPLGWREIGAMALTLTGVATALRVTKN